MSLHQQSLKDKLSEGERERLAGLSNQIASRLRQHHARQNRRDHHPF
jgi:hypothetical protein